MDQLETENNFGFSYTYFVIS